MQSAAPDFRVWVCGTLNPFHNIQAALFDLDGTLVETHIDFPAMKREMLALVRRFGVDENSLRAHDILGVVEEARNQFIRLGRPGEGDQLRMEAFARLEEIEIEQCRNPVDIPGAAELLDRLRRQGIRIGIVTRNCRRVSLSLARFAGLAHDALVTRDDVPLTKPDPTHLRAALSQLGLLAIQRPNDTSTDHEDEDDTLRAVMVGDHWMDVKAGRAAGLATVGILHGRDSGFFEPAPPDLLVEKVADLLPLVA